MTAPFSAPAPQAAPSTHRSTPPDEAETPVFPLSRQGSWAWKLGGWLRTLRPHQWAKNTFVLAPVFFAKDIFQPSLLLSASLAFTVFCLLAGAVYTMNDVVDAEGDRVHPVKRHRPIASGRVPIGGAKGMAGALVAVSLVGAWFLGAPFFLAAAAYFLINVAYSFGWKKIAYLDVACIAAGFVLRVVAGGLATHVYVSKYLLLCTALLALFLGFGKRCHELAQAERTGAAVQQRAALRAYSLPMLRGALWVTAAATVATYLSYTLDPHTRAFFHSDWLWPTTLFTVFGLWRFLQLVTHRLKAESPTQEMLRDVPFLINLVAWIVVVVFIVYRLRPSLEP